MAAWSVITGSFSTSTSLHQIRILRFGQNVWSTSEWYRSLFSCFQLIFVKLLCRFCRTYARQHSKNIQELDTLVTETTSSFPVLFDKIVRITTITSPTFLPNQFHEFTQSIDSAQTLDHQLIDWSSLFHDFLKKQHNAYTWNKIRSCQMRTINHIKDTIKRDVKTCLG